MPQNQCTVSYQKIHEDNRHKKEKHKDEGGCNFRERIERVPCAFIIAADAFDKSR